MKRLIKWLLLSCNLCCVLVLLLGFSGQFLAPNQFSLLSIFSLVYPYSVFLVFFTACLLLFVGSKFIWLSIIVLILTSGTTVRQMGFHFYPELPKQKEVYTLASLNVKNNFSHLKVNQFNDFVADYQTEQPDVFLFQEISKRKLGEVQKALDYPYSSSDFDIDQLSLGVLSRYALQSVATVRNGEDRIVALIMDVLLPDKVIRLINLHLHSNGVTLRAEKFSAESISNRKGIQKLMDMVKSYGVNSALRMEEIEKIKKFILSSPHPVIVAGDTNDTPYSMVYKALTTNLEDSFVKSGLGFAQTYNGLLIPLKIDHIFVDSSLCVFNTNIKKVHYSDHNPISTTFEFCAQ